MDLMLLIAHCLFIQVVLLIIWVCFNALLDQMAREDVGA